jgi:hypothetical protein
MGKLLLFVGDAETERSDRIWWTSAAGGSPPGELIGGPYDNMANVLESVNGPQYDVFWLMDIPIPAGAGHFAYQLQSPLAGNGDSMMNSIAVFCLPTPPPPPEAACCLPDASCVVLTEEDCLAEDGDFYPDLEDCNPDPCAPPPDGCWRTIGFWKHQFNVALGDKNGNQHVPDAQLTALLAVVAGFTTIPDYTGADDVISFREADNFLDLHGKQTKCARALQQHLANLLNYAVNELNGDVMVDTDYDDIPDMEWGDAVEMIENLINTGDEDDCHDAKNMADSINNMEPECEFNDDVDDVGKTNPTAGGR